MSTQENLLRPDFRERAKANDVAIARLVDAGEKLPQWSIIASFTRRVFHQNGANWEFC